MRVTIHQPEHMPWLGFFHKIYMSDVYVVLDNVQFRRRYFQNRNKIRTKNGFQWITIPLKKENRDDLLIKDALICNDDLRWKEKNIENINYNYRKAPFFKYGWEELNTIYRTNYLHLIDLNLALLNFFLKKLRVKKEIQLGSTLKVTGFKGELILNICKTLGADTYISGISGKEYLDLKLFYDAGIDVVFQEFHHPIYRQLYDPFIPCMSIIDLLFNYGEKSINIINGKGVSVMEEMFL